MRGRLKDTSDVSKLILNKNKMGDMEFNGTPEEWDALVKKNKEQETLEEAAARYTCGWGEDDDEKAFIAGAKWQQQQMEKLKIKIQILDEQNNVLISSTINKSTIDTTTEFHGQPVLTDVYNSMLEELSTIKNK